MVTILAMVALAVQERPVVVELRDGTRVEGVLVSFDGRAYVVRVGGEERRFPAAEIRQVTFATESARGRTGDTLLANGDFEDGLSGWEPAYPWTIPEPPRFAAEEGAAQATFPVAIGWCTLTQSAALAEGTEAVRLQGRVRAELTEGGVGMLLVLSSEDGQRQLVHHSNYVAGTCDWTAVEILAVVPRWARRAFVRVGGQARGRAAFDDVSLAAVAGSEVTRAPTGENLLRDGGFELSRGTFCPLWDPVYPMMLPAYQQGQAQPPAWDIDEAVAREGSHSARIASTNQLGFDSYTQNVFRLPAARRVRAEGFVRTRDLGDGEGAAFAILFMDEDGDQIDWRMGDLAAPAEWTRVTLEADVPAGTASIVFRAGMSGAGTAWFDDLSLSGAESGRTILQNGDFEGGLAGWGSQIGSIGVHYEDESGRPQPAVDREIRASGLRALRITYPRRRGWEGMAQEVDLPRERPAAVRFTGRVRTELASGGVTIQVRFVEDGMLAGYHDAEYVTGAADWTSCEVLVNIPPWAQRMFFCVGGMAEGTAWFDALSAEIVPPFDVRCAAAGENVLRDGGFELSAWPFYPRYWEADYPGELPAYQQRQAQPPAWDLDEAVAREGRRSGQIVSTNQLGFNSYTQNVYRLPAARRVRAEGFVRTQDLGDGEGAALAILFMDDAGEQIDWRMGDLAAPTEWTRVTLEAEVPAGTAFIVFRAGMSGAGTAWFDDLSLAGVE